jgi:hypothetical protein
MDEVLELVDVAADFGLEGIIEGLLVLVGVVSLVAGLGLWLLTDAGLLVLPAALMALGVVLLVVPGILLAFADLF